MSMFKIPILNHLERKLVMPTFNSIHILIGSGPANLDRLAHIFELDKDAYCIVVDSRFIDAPERKGSFDREKARANIFALPEQAVCQRMYERGIDIHDSARFRVFEDKARQRHDADFLPHRSRINQIPIRDLQESYLSTLSAKYGKQIQFIQYRIPDDFEDPSVRDASLNDICSIAQIGEDLEALKRRTQISVHVATGALDEEKQADAITYPTCLTPYVRGVSIDTETMLEVQEHGTQTYLFPDSLSFEQLASESEESVFAEICRGMIPSSTSARALFVESAEDGSKKMDKILHKALLDRLEDEQVSLDDTLWQHLLREQGWQLSRPPRIRIFMSDHLYIGTEVPRWSKEDKAGYNRRVEQFTSSILRLVFPNFGKLLFSAGALTPYQTGQFDTRRGEKGRGLVNDDRIKVFHHGDRRYLPHYQTGTGFVTAFRCNQLYFDIYSKLSLETLYEFGVSQKAIDPNVKSFEELRSEYYVLSGTEDESAVLQMMQDELYAILTRDVINANKESVDKYYLALFKQSLEVAIEDLHFKLPLSMRQKLDAFNENLQLIHRPSDDFYANIKPEDIWKYIERCRQLFQKLVALEYLKTLDKDELAQELKLIVNEEHIDLSDDTNFHFVQTFLLDEYTKVLSVADIDALVFLLLHDASYEKGIKTLSELKEVLFRDTFLHLISDEAIQTKLFRWVGTKLMDALEYARKPKEEARERYLQLILELTKNDLTPVLFHEFAERVQLILENQADKDLFELDYTGDAVLVKRQFIRALWLFYERNYHQSVSQREVVAAIDSLSLYQVMKDPGKIPYIILTNTAMDERERIIAIHALGPQIIQLYKQEGGLEAMTREVNAKYQELILDEIEHLFTHDIAEFAELKRILSLFDVSLHGRVLESIQGIFSRVILTATECRDLLSSIDPQYHEIILKNLATSFPNWIQTQSNYDAFDALLGEANKRVLKSVFKEHMSKSHPLFKAECSAAEGGFFTPRKRPDTIVIAGIAIPRVSTLM